MPAIRASKQLSGAGAGPCRGLSGAEAPSYWAAGCCLLDSICIGDSRWITTQSLRTRSTIVRSGLSPFNHGGTMLTTRQSIRSGLVSASALSVTHGLEVTSVVGNAFPVLPLARRNGFIGWNVKAGKWQGRGLSRLPSGTPLVRVMRRPRSGLRGLGPSATRYATFVPRSSVVSTGAGIFTLSCTAIASDGGTYAIVGQQGSARPSWYALRVHTDT